MKKKFVFFILFIFFVFIAIKSFIFAQSQENQKAIQQIDPFEKAVNDLSDKDPYIRRRAAEDLGRLRDARSIAYLRKLLIDDNAFVRQAAVDSLGILRAQEASSDLVKILLNKKEDVVVRQAAAVSMGYIASNEFVKPLVDIVVDTNSITSLRAAACNTLGIIRSTEAVPALILVLSDSDVNLRKNAIDNLKKISHVDVLPALRSRFEIEPEISVKAKILEKLVELNDSQSVERFKYGLNSDDFNMKFYSAIGLAKIANNPAGLKIIKEGLKSQEKSKKILSIDALGFVGDSEALKILKEMLKEETDYVTKEMLKKSISTLQSKYPETAPVQQQKKKE